MIKFICKNCNKEWYSSYEGNKICPSCGGELIVCKELSIKAEEKEKLYDEVIGCMKKAEKKEKKTKENKKESDSTYKGEMDKMKAYDQKFLT